ncbi:HV03 protein, partial [Piaya cayana]|nr:HV03 protein [Piaya cayana]
GLWAQRRLTESGGGHRAHGDSVLLCCHASNFTFEYSSVWWYRQAPGGRLEWVSLISFDSTVISFGPSVQGRA